MVSPSANQFAVVTVIDRCRIRRFVNGFQVPAGYRF